MLTNPTPSHPTLCLQDLVVTKAKSFDENLYSWMRFIGHFFPGGGTLDNAYRVKGGTRMATELGCGTLMLGMPCAQHEGDTDFAGSRVIDILCKGKEAQRSIYVAGLLDMEPLSGLWENYLRIGLCAFDPLHEIVFVGRSRYEFDREDPFRRTCRWCGLTQTQNTSWITMPEPNPIQNQTTPVGSVDVVPPKPKPKPTKGLLGLNSDGEEIWGVTEGRERRSGGRFLSWRRDYHTDQRYLTTEEVRARTASVRTPKQATRP